MSAPAVPFLLEFEDYTNAARARTCKGPLGAREHYSADLLVGVDETERIVELSKKRAVECVERFGAVERHERDAWFWTRREDVLVLLAEDGHEAEGCKFMWCAADAGCAGNKLAKSGEGHGV
jgi:hypothetical protein